MTNNPSSPGLIPDHLLSTIKQGDRVLFLGADLPLGYAGAPLSRPELARALAEKHGLPLGQSWPETATAYLGQLPNDRHGLVSFVLDHNGGPQAQPGPIHAAIARAGFRAIVTAWYDDLLEQALRAAGYRVNRVVRDTQLPYAEEGEREAIVVKLYGCLSDPESLVLDAWDHEELMDRLDRKLELVTSFCSLRPPLFIGFDLLDRTPKRLYVRAARNMAQHMKRAYVVWPHDLAAVKRDWQGKNVEFCRADATAFLQALAAQLPATSIMARGAIRVHRPPYKFLNYYTAADTDIFCGRDTESQIVTRLALSHRLLTLFGPSGAGKTSLLLAGVLPRLAAEGYSHVYVRALDDPLPALRRAVAARAGRADWQSGETLRAFLAAVLAPEDRLVVVLDQLEELFVRVGSGRRAAFFRELAEALTDAEREVRVVFSLREDYLARLDEARACLPDVFANSFRLAALDRANARVAIAEPAARAGVTVEAALVDALVGSEGRPAGGQAGALVETDDHVTRVSPAALQIVLDRLYRGSLPPGHGPEAPPPAGLVLTLAACQAVQHRQQRPGEEPRLLSGAEAILAAYVPDGLACLPALVREDERTPLGADPALGREILKVLVTGQATKAAMTQTEIEMSLEEAGLIERKDRADRELAENTRLGLERVRLVHGFERDGVAFYELTHDYLAREIATWIDQEEMQTKLAREILRRALDNWRHARLLIPSDALKLIHDCCENLAQLTTEELELLLRSALAAGVEVDYWRGRAPAVVGKVEEELFDSLESDDPDRARQAVSQLTTLASPALVARLAGLVEADWTGEPVEWVDHLGKPQAVHRTILNIATPRQRRAVTALARIALPEATAAMDRWTPPGMVLVPAGPFTMGSTEDSDEGPVHEVWLDAFWIDRCPVTVAQWAAFLAGGGWERRELWAEAGWQWRQGKEPAPVDKDKRDHPMVKISWYESLAYARWAGKALLSEAQWEKAARGGLRISKPGAPIPGEPAENLLPERRYPWGNEFDQNKCNTDESKIRGTTPVGKYSKKGGDSPYGCADMAGNVWEWCCNLYVPYPYKAEDGREVLEGTGSRVLRGGSWNYYQNYARCAYRFHLYPDYRYVDSGCRVGWSAPFSPASGL